MKRSEIRLYNVIFPVWLLILFPQLLLPILPANLLVDCGVTLAALACLKHPGKK